MIDLETTDQMEIIKKDLQDLLDSEGWAFVERFLEDRVTSRERELFSMCPDDMPSMVAFARIKGGIDEARLIPEMIKQTLATITEELRSQLENEEEENG